MVAKVAPGLGVFKVDSETVSRDPAVVRDYDAKRDPELRAFYSSAAWQHTRAAKLAAAPVCETVPAVVARPKALHS